MLIPHTFRDSLIEQELSELLETVEDFYPKEAQFCPELFLKEKILENISSVQVLVFGNTSEQKATEFCNEHIVPNFKTVECYHKSIGCPIKAGCIYKDASLQEVYSRKASNELTPEE